MEKKINNDILDFNEAYEILINSREFKNWLNSNKNFYLSHAFIMIDKQVKKEWQLGYCNPENKNIVTFALSDIQKITINPETESLNNEKEILKLDLNKIKIKIEDALKKAENLQKEKYKANSPFKIIVLLQNLEIGQVWNITYVTNTFKTLNIKIDSETGQIISDELIDLFRIEK
ncbi:MAG: hypothetical protein QXR96_00835 [Candidatus Woesearchaeota archaeon]